MSSRKPRLLDALTRDISSRDSADIDRLYGLEPVYEPGTALGGVRPQEFVAFRCPYCGERLETCVDVTAGERTYIEDCQVCCRPIELSVELLEGGALRGVRVQSMD
jgi:hypothetical protein